VLLLPELYPTDPGDIFHLTEPRRIVAPMSSDEREPDVTPSESSVEINHEVADTPLSPEQTDARAELENVLEDLEGYGER